MSDQVKKPNKFLKPIVFMLGVSVVLIVLFTLLVVLIDMLPQDVKEIRINGIYSPVCQSKVIVDHHGRNISCIYCESNSTSNITCDFDETKRNLGKVFRVNESDLK